MNLQPLLDEFPTYLEWAERFAKYCGMRPPSVRSPLDRVVRDVA